MTMYIYTVQEDKSAMAEATVIQEESDTQRPESDHPGIYQMFIVSVYNDINETIFFIRYYESS